MRNGESWLFIDSALMHLWDYFTDRDAALTNTEMLFVGAARPYFDFYFPKLTHTTFATPVPGAGIDATWHSTLTQAQERSRPASELRAEAVRVDPSRTILITTKERSVRESALRSVPVVYVADRAGLVNIEPAWRELRLSLNTRLFDTALVNLGPERAIIIPRLAQVYGIRAIDVSMLNQHRAPSTPSILRRIHGKLKRTLKGK